MIEQLKNYRKIINKENYFSKDKCLKLPGIDIEHITDNLLSKQIIRDAFHDFTFFSTRRDKFNSLKELFNDPEKRTTLHGIDVFKLGRLSSNDQDINKPNFIEIPKSGVRKWQTIAENNNIDISKEKLVIETAFLNIRTLISSLYDLKEEIKEFNEKLKKISDLHHFKNTGPQSSALEHEIEAIVKDDTHILNLYKQESIDEFFKENKVYDSYQTIRNTVVSIQDKIASSNIPSLEQNCRTLAEKSLDDSNLEPIINVVLSPNNKITQFKEFEDGSLLYFKKGETNPSLVKDNIQAQEILKDFMESLIEFKLRKKPSYIKFFKEKMIKENYNIERAYNTIDNFLENETIIKNFAKEKYNSFLTSAFKGNRSLEEIDDVISNVSRAAKVRTYINSIASNKYKFLFDDDTYSIAREIYDLKISKEELQEYIGKKLAAFKTPEDFNQSLRLFLAKANGFEPDAVKNKAAQLEAPIVLETESCIILKIDNYTQSKMLGSQSWCIVRHEDYFDSYTKSANQYFIFDFSKQQDNSLSMIGITIDYDGAFSTAHIKNDDYISKNEVKEFYFDIIKNDLKNFELSEKIKSEYEDFYNKDNKNKKEIKGFKLC